MMILLRLAGALGCILISTPAGGQTIVAAPPYTSNINGFIITEGDIADRPYVELGSVTARRGRGTFFDRQPTRETVNIRLTEAARAMGADAVVRVRYSGRSVSAMSWGGMQADGMAIRYRDHMPSAPSSPPPR